ncbi:MAG: hypothetical protein IJB10_00075 [Clostridia bacterium]|nr:hypothetical protein [Clostridia bacterium]
MGIPYIETNNEKAKLLAEIQIFNNNTETKKTIYYEVEKKYKDFLTTEVSDSFLVALFLYAMEHKTDIECKGKISEHLYYQLTNFLMPAICKNIKKYNHINIKCETTNIEFNGKFNATGVSGGVDSFYTILKNLEHDKNSDLRLTHLTFFNAGASGSYGGERARNLFERRSKKFREIAEELKCDFVTVDSNINEFLMQDHESTHTFRTLSIPLALQKGFKIYYFSSTVEYADFKFMEFDSSFYDLLILPNLSTQNIKFVLVGAEGTRQDKIDYISKHKITYKHLNVCLLPADKTVANCNQCLKCKRTMLNIYLAGKMDEYSKAFDFELFKKNKRKYIRWAIYNKKAIDMGEIYIALKNKKEIKLSDRIIVMFEKFIYGLKKIYWKLGKLKNKRADKK